MTTRAASPRRLRLTTQMQLFQIGILAIVVTVVLVVLLVQAKNTAEREGERQMRAVAEYAAAVPAVRAAWSAENRFVVASALEGVRKTTSTDYLVAVDPDGIILAAPAQPNLAGERLELGPVPDVGGGWTATTEISGELSLVAAVPTIADDGSTLGMVIAYEEHPGLLALLANAVPNLIAYILAATLVGLVGSIVLSRHVRRQILGLEPNDIAELVAHREALLRGMIEGIIVVNDRGEVTLTNNSARELLRLPTDSTGAPVRTLGLSPSTAALLQGDTPASQDAVFAEHGRLLMATQSVITTPDGRREVLTSVRDRGELLALEASLWDSRHAVATLRAQAHEFRNNLHTASVMIQLGESAAVVDFIDSIAHDTTRLENRFATSIGDPVVAALLIAKTSLARERRVELLIDEKTRAGRFDEHLAAELVTIVGNLIDNALDAVTSSAERRVRVAIVESEDSIQVSVDDSGPGVDPSTRAVMFDAGVSSKTSESLGGRGFGLALVRLLIDRRGGQLRVGTSPLGGARFVAVIPHVGNPTLREAPQPVERSTR